jgi:hypothetical protein
MISRSIEQVPATCLYRHPSINPATIISLLETLGYHRAPHPNCVPTRPGIDQIVRLVRDGQNRFLVSTHNLAIVVVGPHAHATLKRCAFVVGGVA